MLDNVDAERRSTEEKMQGWQKGNRAEKKMQIKRNKYVEQAEGDRERWCERAVANEARCGRTQADAPSIPCRRSELVFKDGCSDILAAPRTNKEKRDH